MAHMFHPGLGVDVNYEVTQVPDGGDGQTADVISLMTKYASADADSNELRTDAHTALMESPGQGAIPAVFWFVKRRLKFTQDNTTAIPIQAKISNPDAQVVEVLIRPRDMSTLCSGAGNHCIRQGDCDDFSMYTAALLLALNVPCKFVTVAASPASNDYSHVYVAAYDPYTNERVPLDTSHGDYPGWETQSGHRIQEWDIPAPGSIMTPAILAAAIAAAIGAYYLCR